MEERLSCTAREKHVPLTPHRGDQRCL